MNVKGGTQHQINLLGIRRWTLSAISATPAGGQHTPPLSDVTRSQGAQFEIRIDGTPRSYRDRKDFAMGGRARAALGGAIDYVVRGKMIGGFALLAYPAEYGNSGVMTFVVNHQDVVFQKDLGLSTARVAGAMTTFNPDQSWSRVVIQQPQSQR